MKNKKQKVTDTQREHKKCACHIVMNMFLATQNLLFISYILNELNCVKQERTKQLIKIIKSINTW